jgi:hypothetical protein
MDLFNFARCKGIKTMRALLIVAGLFFSIFGGVVLYFAAFGDSHQYDLKFVLPIDTRQMPKPAPLPGIMSQEEGASSAVTDGRADSSPLPRTPERPLVQFGNRSGAASEAAGQ